MVILFAEEASPASKLKWSDQKLEEKIRMEVCKDNFHISLYFVNDIFIAWKRSEIYLFLEILNVPQ